MNYKAMFAKLFGRTVAPTTQPPKTAKKKGFSAVDLARIDTPVEVFRPAKYVPPEGVLPKNKLSVIAADSNINYNQPHFLMYNNGFMGYPTLAQMIQEVEYRSPTETLAREMTHKWIKVTSKSDKDVSKKIADIEHALKVFKVKDVLKKAIEHDGFYGCGHIVIRTNCAKEERVNPLIVDKATIRKGDFLGLANVEPIWTTPSQYNSIDPIAEDFYKPCAWYILGSEVHSSRMFSIVGHPVSDMLKPAYNFGGLSQTQILKSFVENWQCTRNAVASLIKTYSLSGIKTDMAAMLEDPTNSSDLINRAEAYNKFKNNRGLLLLGLDEEFFQFNTPLSGLDKLQEQSQQQMASACHQPLVKFMGATKGGLNSSSEEELQCWYDYVSSLQHSLLGEPLHKILQIIQLHLFGEIDEGITFEFMPLQQLSEKEQAEVQKTKADTATTYIQGGVVSAEEVRTKIAHDEHSGFNSIDVSKMPDIEDEEELGKDL